MAGVATTDWQGWHAKYDDPAHPLSRRLVQVRRILGRTLESRDGRPTQLVSMCAGDGRDTLPVLATGHLVVDAVLVELDERLAGAARDQAVELGLANVEVRTGDAGALATYSGVRPADVLLACGVFGNITDDDLETTVASLPRLLAPDATVIWTRGIAVPGDPTARREDPVALVRETFARHGFEEVDLTLTEDGWFGIGVHRFTEPAEPTAPVGERMFAFVR